ncbi:MAG: hypothetical protein WB621_24740, partial [Candidatus Acidiferrales bacterium]
KFLERIFEWTIHRNPTTIAVPTACSFHRRAARTQPIRLHIRRQLAGKFSIREVLALASITLPTARSLRCPQIQKEEP